jgi:hypothetical protein
MYLDDLLKGAFDLHCHVYPEMTLEHEARQDDIGQLSGMQAAGMGGVVLKSHFWPTVDRCYYLSRQFPDLDILPSIALNRVAGGLDPLVVDAAGHQGARVVFFPTWDSANDRRRGGFSKAVKKRLPAFFDDDGTGLEILDGEKLSATTQTVLDAAQQSQMLVCTGHLSPAEGRLVIEAARQRGLQALFSHPLSGSIGASLDNMRAAIGLGALVELCVLHTLSLNHYTSPRDIADVIKAVGAENCVLSTDAFNSWVPPAHEILRLGIGQLLECGLSEDEIRTLTVTNPRRLLRLGDSSVPVS